MQEDRMHMKNVFISNAHAEYSFSPGKLNASLVDKASEHFAAKGYSVRATTIQDDSDIENDFVGFQAHLDAHFPGSN